MTISQFEHANFPLVKRFHDFPIVVYDEAETGRRGLPNKFDFYEFGILLEGSIELNVGHKTYTISGGGLLYRTGHPKKLGKTAGAGQIDQRFF